MFGKKQKNKVKNQNHKLVNFKPTNISDSKKISQELLKGNVILIDFSQTPSTISIRVVDFISGMLMAINGDYRKLATKLFLISSSKELSDMYEEEIKSIRR